MAARVTSLDRRAVMLALLVSLQMAAALFFVIDAALDITGGDWGPHVAVEAVIAIALIAGVALGALALRDILGEARRTESALAVARSAMTGVMIRQFAEWQLTTAEADVALFLLKGFEIAEIARLRGVAAGTVRAQLASIYAKAGVSSQAQLMSCLLDALIDAPARASMA